MVGIDSKIQCFRLIFSSIDHNILIIEIKFTTVTVMINF